MKKLMTALMLSSLVFGCAKDTSATAATAQVSTGATVYCQ